MIFYLRPPAHILFKDWTFDRETGLMRKRMMSGNDVRITNEERWFTKGPEHVDEVEITERHL